MKAIGHYKYGGPEVLQVVELPDPAAGAGEVRVRVHAAGVSPTDTLRRAGLRAGEMEGEEQPYVPGMDLAGVIDQVGPGSQTNLSVGDHVMGMLFPSGTRGAYSELVVMPLESVTKIPAGSDDVSAATLPMNGLTARRSLDLLGLERGQTLAVTGAAGTYGGYVVQLAKVDGLRVVADAARTDRELVRSLGADVVVDRGDDVAARFREAVPEGVDGLVDGAVLDDKVVAAIRPGGGIVTVRHYAGDPANQVTYFPVRGREYAREWAKLDRLRALVEEGRLTLRVAGTYPAERAADAHRRLADGGTRGRLVLTFN